MEQEKIAEVADRLAGYLTGAKVGGFRVQESFRQLAQRVLAPLSDSETALLRQALPGHRMLVLGALSEALRNDPVARHLASQLCTPEESAPPRTDTKPRTSGDHHVSIRGNGNVVGDGNTIGSISVPVPQTSGGLGKERRERLIRILFLSANPDKRAFLHTDREVRDIQEALRQSEFRDQFDLRQEPAVRINDLQRCLMQHRPDIVHFSGHGYQGALLLEGRNGKIFPVLGRDLADLLSALKGRTRCIFLNSCYSAAEADPIAGVIDAVIARPDKVKDRAAILFSTYFYQALAFGRSVREAFDLACLQLRMERWGDGEHPVLLATHCDPEEIRFAEVSEP